MSTPDVQKNILLKKTAASLLTTPEEITNDLIRELGDAYLSERRQANRNCCTRFFDSLAHSNHAIAYQLKNYAEKNDEYNKWMFLADCYARLPNNNGQIANAILMLFQLAFKEVPFAYETVHAGSHKTKQGTYTPAERANGFKLTINNYYIKKFHQELGSNIDQQTYYGSTHLHALANNPGNLSNAIIQNLGDDYLQKHGLEAKGCLPLLANLNHHNQPVASILKKYSKATSAYEKWLFLADTYASLQESHGELSDAILHLFATAFGQNPYTNNLQYMPSRYGGYYYHDYYSPATVSLALKGLVTNCYAEMYQNQLQIRYAKVP